MAKKKNNSKVATAVREDVYASNFALRDLYDANRDIERDEFRYPKELIVTDKEIEKAILDTYREVGRVRIPLPALVASVMLRTGVSPLDASQFIANFQAIHHFIRTHWGNGSMLHRRTGWKYGGIKIRNHIKL